MPSLLRAFVRRLLPALLLAAAPAILGGAPRAYSGEVPKDLQEQINKAVDAGAKWLKAQQRDDGSFSPLLIDGAERHAVGTSSLAGLALLASEVPKTDACFKKLIDFLKQLDGRDAQFDTRATYGAGALIMFLTEYYMTKKREKPKAGSTVERVKENPCGLPKDVQEWVQDLARWIVSKQMDDGWWRYPLYPPPDLSNTQYALLGLRAAKDCGAAVPSSCFQKAMERTLQVQQQDGPKVKQTIPGSGKPGESDYVVDAGDRARGWPYQADNGVFTGSMTTAGIAVLAIARDALLKPQRYAGFTEELERKVRRSVQDGFAWLDLNFAVNCNPPPGAPAWHYYYLYGLERACAVGGRDMIGKHDWYVEGSKYLVAEQKKEGRWSTGALGAKEVPPDDLLDTEWALLFLKKATFPTIPMPVVTSGD